MCVVSRRSSAVVATVPGGEDCGIAVREVVVAVAGRRRSAASRRSGSQPSLDVVRFEYVTPRRWPSSAAFGRRLPARRRPARPGPSRALHRGRSAGWCSALTLAYGELLRRYGTPVLVECDLRRHPAGCASTPAPRRGRSSRCSASRRWCGASTCARGAGRAGGSAPSGSVATAPIAQALLDPIVPRQECGAGDRLRRGRRAAARRPRDPGRPRAHRRPQQPRPARPPGRGGRRAPTRTAAHRRAAVSTGCSVRRGAAVRTGNG